VIARNSSFAYKGKPTTESEVGKELGVKYLLEGSIRKAADQVRIGVELVDASSGREMWTQNYNGPLKNVFAVQDEIVDKVVTTLGLLFKLEKMRLPHGGPSYRTQNLEAFDDLLRAEEGLWRLTKDGNATARQWAERSIELDPKSADVYALMGASYWQDALFRRSKNPEEDLRHSAEFAQKALALDDSNSSALGLMCEIDWMRRQFDRAIAEGERAVAINPNDPNGYEALSDALINSDKFEEAADAAKTAMPLDPAGQDFYAFFLGSPYVFMGRYDDAIALLQKHIVVFPDNLWAHAMLAMAYVELGRNQDARAQASEVMRINPQFALPPPEKETNESIAVNKRFQSDMRKAGLK
jgi:adenylate cyclase